jgi:hypothetical protein
MVVVQAGMKYVADKRWPRLSPSERSEISARLLTHGGSRLHALFQSEDLMEFSGQELERFAMIIYFWGLSDE